MGKKSDSDSSQTAEDWQPISTFIVEYQQQVISVEVGKPLVRYRSVLHNLEQGDGAEWEGLVEHELAEWVLSRTAETAGNAYQQQLPDKGDGVVRMPVRFSLEKVEAGSNDAFHAICIKDGVFSGYVSHAHPLDIKVHVHVAGMDVNDKVGCCMVGFSALRISDGKRFFLGWSPLDKKWSSKTSVEIKGVRLQRGAYTLRVTAVLENCRPRLAVMEASILVVV